VITAAAMRCLGGEIHARLTPLNDEQRRRIDEEGIEDPNRLYTSVDLASGENIILCCTGITDGQLLKGIRLFGGGHRASSLYMSLSRHLIRFVESIHRDDPETPVFFQ